MFAGSAAAETGCRRPPALSTLRRVRAARRAAINAAVRAGWLRGERAKFVGGCPYGCAAHRC
jgi:hypothetical protein